MKIKLLSAPVRTDIIEAGKVYQDEFKNYWIVHGVTDGYIRTSYRRKNGNVIRDYHALTQDSFKDDKLKLIGVIL